jgi:hypothetical protein
MKAMPLLASSMMALVALLIHTASVDAETSIEIRLTLLPADAVNAAGPGWTPCSSSPQAFRKTGGAGHAVVTRLEKDERKDGKPRIIPASACPPIGSHYQLGDKNREGGAPLPTTKASFNDDLLEGSPVLHLCWNSLITEEQPAKRITSTIAGGATVLVIPIRISAQDGVVPHFRQVSVRLAVILPSVRRNIPSPPPLRYTFRSGPIEQSQPLPRATLVLKQPRIPGASLESKLAQSRRFCGEEH